MNRLPFLICAAAVVLALAFGFYYRHAGLRDTAAARAREVKAERKADSLTTQLQVAAAWTAADIKQTAGIDAGKQAQADENTIRATPAAGWDDDSLTRFLASPNRANLHPKSPGRPQRR